MDQNKLLEILKEMRIPDYLTSLLRNLYAGQEATIRTGYGIMDWFQIGKGVHQGCILSPLFNLYAECIVGNASVSLIILFMMQTVSLFTLLTEPRVGKARAKRLEED